MTKKEFSILRAMYRKVCRDLWVQVESRLNSEFILSDSTLILCDALSDTLREFASKIGCTVPVAADILNLRKTEG